MAPTQNMSVELETLTDAHGHLDFVQMAINRHTLDKELRQDLQNQIEVIQRRSEDSNLYLAIVGEMSTGKSTFINALLRDKLLIAHPLTMTTAAATVIKHGSDLQVEVRFHQPLIPTSEPINTPTWSGVSRLFGGEEHVLSNDNGQERAWTAKNLEFLSPQSRLLPTQIIQVSVDHEPITIEWLPRVRDLTVRRFIECITTSDDLANKVLSVTLTHPASFLADGIFVIDTPGLDATNPDHTVITGDVIREVDAAVVIIPADKPVAHNLIECLNDASLLKPYLHRCVFLLTRIDLVPQRERERLIKTVGVRLKNGLNLPEVPPLFVCSAQSIVDSLTNELVVRSADDRQEWQHRFVELEHTLFARLKKERYIAIAENILRLLDNLMTVLESPLQALWETYRQHEQALEKARIRDLKSFATEQHNLCNREMTTIINQTVSQVEITVNNYRQRTIDKMHTKLFKVSSPQELNEFVQDKAQNAIKRDQGALRSELKKKVEELDRVSKEVNDLFDQRFNEAYAKLALLQRGSQKELTLSTLGQSSPSNMVSLIQSQNEQENFNSMARTGAGLAAGAIIGTIIAPGIGTVIGAALGGWISTWFGPSLDERKNKVWDELRPNLIKYYDEIQQNAVSAVNDYGGTLRNNIHDRINQHIQQYQTLVDEMMAEQQREKEHVLRFQKSLEEDIGEIQRRQEIVRARQTKLRTMTF